MTERTSAGTSNLTRKYELLQARAQRKPNREPSIDLTSDAAKKANIGHLKEFYLQRLAKAEPNGPVAARLPGGAAQAQKLSAGDTAQPQASGQHSVGRGPGLTDVEDLEIMCNNCFNLIQSSEAARCNGDQHSCIIASRFGGSAPGGRPASQVAVLDLKLQKLRDALEVRLQDASSKVNVMRHLTQLRYNIDAAAKWVPGCSEIGALSDHTVQQVKQLTATSRVLAPAVYIFSKRVENVIVQKERELRRALVQVSSTRAPASNGAIVLDDREDFAESVADVNSIVSELDSNCGTEYAETTITQENVGTMDVGNIHDANDYLTLRNEDDQRRWFYSQCLTVKLACADKTRARKILISDLYSRARAEAVPIEGWVQWIRAQLMPEEDVAITTPASRRPA